MSNRLRPLPFRKTLYSLIFLLCFPSVSDACRFWGGVGDIIPGDVIIEDLIKAEHSLKNLGEDYKDGWSVGYHSTQGYDVIRGSKPVHLDGEFDAAVKKISEQNSQIIFGHLRRASSGCVKDVPNPHPFQRDLLGKNWLFGHNGGMKKEILLELIGEEYLNSHLPQTCTYAPPDSWIDSELYFIYLLKYIEEHAPEVEDGLISALEKLYQVIEPENRYFNFFLTDGQMMWAFKKGNTLFYKYDQQQNISKIASTIPQDDSSTWNEFPEDSLAIMQPGKNFKFIPLEE